jgi:tRNA pseudouridine38-40 synthase
MPTYRLIVEYEGTRYRGWQEQENVRTVGGELRRALSRVAGPVLDLGASGRTDAGVHALAQVAHLRLARSIDAGEVRRQINDLLPTDIEVLGLELAPERFHARHDALFRSYVYQLSRRRTAFAKPIVWWVKRPLDAERLRSAWSMLVGRHDFARFCEQPESHPSTVVVVDRAEVAEDGDLVLLRLVASHFLWKMVRRLVGTVVEVGTGDLPPDLFAHIIAGYELPVGTGGPAAWTAPPSGLFLERVLYGGDPPLPALAAITPVTTAPAGNVVLAVRTANRAGSRPAPGRERRDDRSRGSAGRPAGAGPRRAGAGPRGSVRRPDDAPRKGGKGRPGPPHRPSGRRAG